MKNKISVKAIATFAIATILLTGSGFINKKESPCANYRITIINKYWNSMHLQVKAGNQSVPDSNPIARDVILKKGESVTVDYDVLCYYRRDANPDNPDNVHFTNWTSAGCFRNNPCVVDNP